MPPAEVLEAVLARLLSPLSWLLIAMLGLYAGARWTRRPRWLPAASALLALVAAFAMTPVFANLLVGWLERPRPQPASCLQAPPTVAVVLAAGSDPDAGSSDDPAVLNIAARRRMERAVAWWHAEPARTLVVAGAAARDGGKPESWLMARYAERLGVPAAAILTEQQSTSTWQNARQLAAMGPSLPRRVVLVSSAMHLPRAEYAMRRAGFEVCALPADPRYLPSGSVLGFVPRGSALVKSEAGLHELVGAVYYRLRPQAAAPAR